MKRSSVKWWKSELGIAQKSDVEGRIHAIVKSNVDRVALNAMDQHWMEQVLKHHYQYKAKIGCGLKHFEIRTNYGDFKPTRGFWIVRTDGTSIDISWPTAMQPHGRPSPQNDVSYSARFEIKNQIDAHHKGGICNLCPLCDREMERGVNLHVDHAVPFKQLLADFLHSKSLTYEQVAIEDLGLSSRFADHGLGAEWQTYHQSHASLRLTHGKCNLSRRAA